MYAFMFSPNVLLWGRALLLRPPMDCQVNRRTRAESRPSANAVWGRNLYAPWGCRRAVHAWQPGGLVCSRLALTSVRTDITPGQLLIRLSLLRVDSPRIARGRYEWLYRACSWVPGHLVWPLHRLCSELPLGVPLDLHSVLNLSCGLGGGVSRRSGLIAEPPDH